MTRKRLRLPSPAIFALMVLAILLLLKLPDAVNDTPPVTPTTSVRVTRVIDGDTVEVEDGRRIRLLGIDAPEIGYNGDPSEKGAAASQEWLRQRIKGASVQLRYGPERLDRYGRTLAWIFMPGGELINKELLEAGQARLLTRFGLPADLSPELYQATATARVQRRGIWSKQ